MTLPFPAAASRRSAASDATLGHRAATVEIGLKDGTQLRHHQPTRKGDPDAPLSDAELAAKFLELASPALGDTEANDLLVTLGELDMLDAAAIAVLGISGAR